MRLNPAVALEKREEYRIDLNPRILYLPKDPAAKVLPDGSIVPAPPHPDHPVPVHKIDADGAEIIEIDGIEEEPILAPIDTDTGLPQTGIDVNTGLPVDLPEGVEFVDPTTGKKMQLVDLKVGRALPEGPPPTDP